VLLGGRGGAEGASAVAGVRLGFLPYAQLHAWGGDAIRDALVALGAGAVPPLALAARAVAASALFIAVQLFPCWIFLFALRWTRAGTNSFALVVIAAAVGVGACMLDVVGAFYCINPSWLVGVVLLVAALPPRFADSRTVATGALLLTAAALAVDLRWDRGVRSKIASPPGSPPPGGPERVAALRGFRDALESVRDRTHVPGTILRPGAELRERASGWSCTRRPFVYPAVSEVPWVGALEPDPACRFAFYGYEDYFAADGSLRPPAVPAGFGPVTEFPGRPEAEGEETSATRPPSTR
jgi:hypothetical protein